ncbi:MFS transporter [Dietzia sp.]|uniref:MFS transporter n=1 Tax=Dietzia sp. TaxID=1871616 RepID=UPI003FA54B23
MSDNEISTPSANQNSGGSSHEEHEVDKSVLHKAIAASAMGNATEWFDYGVYSTVAVYITMNFFPGGLESIGTMLGLAVSFVLRPLGGFVWGPIGDKLGRKSVLALTIILMSVTTAAIGLIPTHEQIGVWAIILLFALRIVQGFTTGGEYGGAATFMAEYAPDKRRGHYGSFLEFGTLAGFVGGSGIVLILQTLSTDEFMNTWGWRIPFFFALPLGLIGLYLRSQLDETPVFQEFVEEEKAETKSVKENYKDLFTTHFKQVAIMFGMVTALNVSYYTLLTYQPTYLSDQLGIEGNHATIVMIVGQVVMMAMIPFLGSLSDRVGRKPMWWTSLIGLFIMAVPMYLLMRQSFGWAIVAFVVLGVLFIPQLSTISATFPAMFPTTVRYAGFAISYNLATAAFGGTAPLISDSVIAGTGFTLFPAVFMMIACVIGMVAVYFMTETAGASLRGDGVPGECPENLSPIGEKRAGRTEGELTGSEA